MTRPGSDTSELTAALLHPGSATGELLVLDEPVSFWGGVSADGEIVDAHHRQCGTSITGRVVAMTSGRGSSSASSVLAEQIRSGSAPAAIILAEPDTILVLGAVVAAELYGRSMPIVRLDAPAWEHLVGLGDVRLTVTAEDEAATIRRQP